MAKKILMSFMDGPLPECDGSTEQFYANEKILVSSRNHTGPYINFFASSIANLQNVAYHFQKG